MPDHLTNNEKILLLKVAEGDENAFSTLFKTYYNHLGEYILRLTECQQLTQEIVQDVFLKIWLNRSSLAGIDCFKGYLLVVARNHAFNCLKQIARERTRKKKWVNTVLHHASHTIEDTDIYDPGCLIDKAVELLPSQQKKVYTLSRKDGIRQQEIARELNISHETVKKHMVLALRFLKNHLRSHISLFAFVMTGLLQK